MCEAKGLRKIAVKKKNITALIITPLCLPLSHDSRDDGVHQSNASTTIEWIVMTFGTNIHYAQRMNPNDCGSTLIVHVLPPADQN